jgi:hypothetical protein
MWSKLLDTKTDELHVSLEVTVSLLFLCNVCLLAVLSMSFIS